MLDELIAAGDISEPLLTGGQFSALVMMAFVTTMVAPISLKWSVMRVCRSDEEAPFCRLWEEG